MKNKLKRTPLTNLTAEIAERARKASFILAKAPSGPKNDALLRMAEGITGRAAYIIGENSKDVEEARAKGLSPAMIDRLMLTDDRLEKIADGLRQVAALEDPVGGIVRTWRRPNGLLVGK
ncbi:MAG TPA: gamma-glutamyl-phosphate reductase, partial [Thermodesulfobacteriota bacterium]|nr:gamma-glutamyl-phosphate reductase [Thermodesulfobacteriota bacterium]